MDVTTARETQPNFFYLKKIHRFAVKVIGIFYVISSTFDTLTAPSLWTNYNSLNFTHIIPSMNLSIFLILAQRLPVSCSYLWIKTSFHELRQLYKYIFLRLIARTWKASGPLCKQCQLHVHRCRFVGVLLRARNISSTRILTSCARARTYFSKICLRNSLF